MPVTAETYSGIQAIAQELTGAEAKAFTGEMFDMPGVEVYRQTKHRLPTGGTLEINAVTRQAQAHFAWLYEITIDDLANDLFKHVLLRAGNEIEETYGKTVIELDEAGAKAILQNLERLRDGLRTAA